MLTFAYYYLRSMRLYYGFVTGTTTLVGCLLSGHTLAESRTWLLFTMGFFAWGSIRSSATGTTVTRTPSTRRTVRW